MGGCGTCGKKKAQSGKRSGKEELFQLITPEGKKKVYASEAEARNAQGRLGGVVSKQRR